MSQLDALTPGPLRVTIETDDPTLARLLDSIAEYPVHMPVRYQMEARLYDFLRQKAEREAERLIVRRHDLDGHS